MDLLCKAMVPNCLFVDYCCFSSAIQKNVVARIVATRDIAPEEEWYLNYSMGGPVERRRDGHRYHVASWCHYGTDLVYLFSPRTVGQALGGSSHCV